MHKFMRLRLNPGILPLSTIRGSLCEGCTDGMCEMSKFIESQKDAERLANNQFACFGNYTITGVTDGQD
jgi:hypothetical protein